MITVGKYIASHQQDLSSKLRRGFSRGVSRMNQVIGEAVGKNQLSKSEKVASTITKIAGEIFFALGALMVVAGAIKSASIIGLPLGIVAMTLGVALAVFGHTIYQIAENYEKDKGKALGTQSLARDTVFAKLGLEKEANRAIAAFMNWVND